MSRIHFIFPKDSTTDFLDAILTHLEPYGDYIKLYRVETYEQHSQIFGLAPDIPNDDLIVFLGHGTSSGLSGANTKDVQYGPFITEGQLGAFEDKNVLLVSCRSAEYLQGFAQRAKIRSGIGFPNLVTDYEEIEHYDELERAQGLTGEDIEMFKSIICDVVKYSLEDYLKFNLNKFHLFKRIELRITKRLINFYQGKREKLALGRMIYDMNNGICFYNRI